MSDFEVFRPAEAICCTDKEEILRGAVDSAAMSPKNIQEYKASHEQFHDFYQIFRNSVDFSWDQVIKFDGHFVNGIQSHGV